MRFFLLLPIWFFCAPTFGACQIPADPGDLRVEVSLPASLAAHESELIFGHPRIGFFKAPLEKHPDGSARVLFFPVTYKYPMEFYLPHQGKSFRKQFPSPLSCYEQKTRRTGTLQRPFYYLSWVLRNEIGRQFYFPAVINREGELVWAQTGSSNAQNLNYPVTGQATDQELILLSQFGTARISVFPFAGSGESWDLAAQLPPVFANHSFASLGKGKIAFIATHSEKVSIFRDYLFRFRGFLEILNLFFSPSRIFVGNDVDIADIPNRSLQRIYSSFSYFNTFRDIPGIYYDDPPVDPFLDREADDQTLLDNPQVKGNPMGHVDWTHENTVDYDPHKGYLITVRNLNSLVWLDPQGHFKGKIGTSPDSTWRWPADVTAFSMPHSARFSGDSILLFDNAAASRFVISAPQSRVLKFKIPRPGDSTIQVEKEIPITGPISHDRGSVYPISTTAAVVFITRVPRLPLAIREYDLLSGDIKAELEFEWPFERRSQEAVPISSLGYPEEAFSPERRKFKSISADLLEWKISQRFSTPIEKDIY